MKIIRKTRTMKLAYISCCLLLCTILLGCQNNNDGAATDATTTIDLKEEILGTWQTVQVNVAINSADGLDSFRTESITEDVWRNNFGIQPPLYYFHPDTKYRCVRKNLAGDIIDELEGNWKISGDTLLLIQADTTEKFVLKSSAGRSTWRTFRDWDEDGKADDEYQELQRKISIGVN